MNTRIPSTLVAAVLTLAALGLPCIAWYVTGSRAARKEAELLRRAPLLQAQLEVRRMAERVGSQLEALRLSESRRSFLDYRTQEDTLLDVACEPRLISPLSEGPTHPLIWAHFQIDSLGVLTLPTLTADEVSAGTRQALQAQHAIFESLECALPDAHRAPPPGFSKGLVQPVRGTTRDWDADVGAMSWNTVDLDGQPALVAVRAVRTPEARFHQGFAVHPDALRKFVEDWESPVTILPGLARTPEQSRVPLEGAHWIVEIDASKEIAAGDRLARRGLARFRNTFAGGLVAALFAGGLVVSLVWQSERLASQRARFAASAAHELRTPLAGLRMYGEMLADGPKDPARQRRYAERIASEAERLGRVVSNLLGFSRLERGELIFDSTPGDLSATVRSSIDQLRPALEASGARIDVEMDGSLPELRFNRDAVHQILQNLLDNAEKYGRSAKDRTIRVELSREDDGACLSVVDHGPGLDPAVRRSLFRPFTRHAGPDAPAGLGLGLAIVQALAQAQNAIVTYVEEPLGGSRFMVTFRAAG